ncbi:hypothetical protein [Candidatus Nitrospira bockiana]
MATLLVSAMLWQPTHAADEVLFAVVTKISKDKRTVTAQAIAGGTVAEVTLIPTDTIMDNPIWRKLEVCHSLKADAVKVPEGYQITSIRMLDAGMLPMSLQGIAGDCLLRKALEFAPLVD